jgi:hypothetical protein
MSEWVAINTRQILNQCSCGSRPSLYTFIDGIENHRNYLVACACGKRTRNRGKVIDAVDDWNGEAYSRKREEEQ